MYQKFLKIISVVLCAIILIFSFLPNQAKKLQLNQVKLAVVNLDNGVIDEKNQNINYGREFLNLDFFKKNKDILVTKFSDAKNGFNNNVYSGYIVIPHNFSEAIESVNTIPVTIELKYQVTDDENFRESTQNIINQFYDALEQGITKGYIATLLNNVAHTQNNLYTVEETVNANGELINEKFVIDSPEFLDLKDLEETKIDSDLLTPSNMNYKNHIDSQFDEKIGNQNDKKYLNLVNTYETNKTNIENELTKEFFKTTCNNGFSYKDIKFVFKDKENNLINPTLYINKNTGNIYLKNNTKIFVSPVYRDEVRNIELDANKFYSSNQIMSSLNQAIPMTYNLDNQVYYFYPKEGKEIKILEDENILSCINVDFIKYNNQLFKTPETIQFEKIKEIDFKEANEKNGEFIEKIKDGEIIFDGNYQAYLEECGLKIDAKLSYNLKQVNFQEVKNVSINPIEENINIKNEDIINFDNIAKNIIDFQKIDNYINQIPNNIDYTAIEEDQQIERTKQKTVLTIIRENLTNNRNIAQENTQLLLDFDQKNRQKIDQQLANTRDIYNNSIPKVSKILKETKNDLGYVRQGKLLDYNVINHISNSVSLIEETSVIEQLKQNVQLQMFIRMLMFFIPLTIIILIIASMAGNNSS